MSLLAWIALAGGLLLGMALSSTYLRRLPVTSSGIYLALGLAISPAWLDLIEIDFVRESVLFEHVTTIAVIVSLFVGGLKLRLPLTHSAWSAAFRLAGPVMIATIAGVAVIAHYGFGLGLPAAFLLGSVLAPTDPVLAGMVTVNDAGDQDRMRYGLSGEAGFNDGAAFPFVVFSLLWLEHGAVGAWAGEWAMHRLLWAVPAGLLLGYGLGKGVSRLAILLRSRNPDSAATGDFLALALIALSYAGAEFIGAWGFLAVFAAGLGFRRTEVETSEAHPAPEHLASQKPGAGNHKPHPPAEDFAANSDSAADQEHPTKAAGNMVAEIISFGDTAERLLEMMMVVLGQLLGLACGASRAGLVWGGPTAFLAAVPRQKPDPHVAALVDGMVRHPRHWQSLLPRIFPQSRARFRSRAACGPHTFSGGPQRVHAWHHQSAVGVV
jgi:Kef-type K+ transport system membrane component KefB